MTLRHLRIFLAVAEEENVTRAAERLYMTQPAVTRTVQELEEHLGLQLFDRIGRRLYLNEMGTLFRQKTMAVLSAYEDLEETASHLEERAALRVGSSITIANYILPKVVKRFQERYPDTSVRVQVDNARAVEAMVVEHAVDLGLVEGALCDASLMVVELSSYSLSIVCSPDHPLAGAGLITPADLLRHSLLLREPGSAIRDVFDSALVLHNLVAVPIWTSVNSTALLQGVRENLGISVLPRILVEDDIQSGRVAELAVQGLALTNRNQLAYLKEKRLTTAMKRFIELLQQ